MRRVKMLASAMMVGGLLLSAGSGMALAQSSTDGPDLSPNPDQCNQAPRTIEEVEAALGAATPETMVDMSAPEGFELPPGEDVPNEARGGIVETIVQIIACGNGGDQLASLGGVTDSLFATMVGAGFLGENATDNLMASPVALSEESQTELIDTREFTVYDDGRVGVLVYYRVPIEQASDPDAVQIALWTFEEVDGRWLLDEMVTGLEAQLGDMATPPAG